MTSVIEIYAENKAKEAVAKAEKQAAKKAAKATKKAAEKAAHQRNVEFAGRGYERRVYCAYY